MKRQISNEVPPEYAPYLRDLHYIKRQGFGAFKIELECNMPGRDSDESCNDWFLAHLSESTRKAVAYSEFYYDGSVDTELTLTVPILDAWRMVEIIETMIALNDVQCGTRQVDSRHAGMHLTIMPNTTYPSRVYLDVLKLRNFQNEVTKLMPGLIAGGTHNGKTRGYQYRYPAVKNTDKYSAIYTHNKTCLEYRVFDTCYDDPKAVLDKIAVIAKTLEFYSTDPKRKVNLKHNKFSLFEAPTVADSLIDSENLACMNETLKYLIPRHLSAVEFKKARAIDITRAKLAQQARARLAEYRFEYEAYTLEQRAQFLRDFSYWYKSQAEQIGAIAHQDTKFMESEYKKTHRTYEPMSANEFIKRQFANKFNRIDLELA